ncbi:hypothetical protein ACIHCX_03440 [Streptomyces sp. NPDC052043]|uniref:hypothetical protein n=1 Tax=Streptomyces sp. NPDC052043 TaxID=3365684 RepID=UPI0037D83B55
MPRTSANYSKLVPNGRLTDPAGTTIDATLVTNGVAIDAADPEHTLIRVTNSAGAAKTVTVRAGVGRQSWMAGSGDYTQSVPASGTVWLGPFTSARFQQKGSKLNVDFESGTTGTVTVFKLPRAL